MKVIQRQRSDAARRHRVFLFKKGFNDDKTFATFSISLKFLFFSCYDEKFHRNHFYGCQLSCDLYKIISYAIVYEIFFYVICFHDFTGPLKLMRKFLP